MKLIINKSSQVYWRITIDNPPLNLFDQELADELTALIDELEKDAKIKVVVFDSADPDYFMAHLDLLKAGQLRLDPGPTGLSAWPDFAYRIERASFITVGLIRGRARGVGSEFVQALDMRFASREKAIFSQIEVGTGVIPGGGGLERLTLLVGRARAMEIIIGADDFDADTAEKYGWINRSISDSELDAFVERFAQRVAGFNKASIALAKDIINKRTKIAQKEDLAYTQERFFETLTWPETQATVASLLQRGLQQRGELEERLGHHLGPLEVVS